MQLDESRRQLFEGSRRGEGAIDERPASTLRRNFATHQPLFPAIFEDGFDGGGVFSRADQVARRTAAEEQAYGFDEDRLPCTGFAGQDVEPGLEIDLDGVDNGEVANFQKAEHEKRENSNPNIGLTAILPVCYCVL